MDELKLFSDLPPRREMAPERARSMREELLHKISEESDPSSPRPRVRPVLAAAAAAVLILIGVGAVGGLRPEPAHAAVTFAQEGGTIIATVQDPVAAAAELHDAFSQRGLDIHLRLVPASPSKVGTVIAVEDSAPGIAPLAEGPCLGDRCPVGLRIPADFAGRAEITLGRPARPGEPYVATASAYAPGEPLACTQLYGSTVAEARAIARRENVEITWKMIQDDHAVEVPPNDVSDDWYVGGATASNPARVRMWVSTSPLPDVPSHPACHR